MPDNIDDTDNSAGGRIIKCFKENIKPSLTAIRFLLIIILPVSFAILVLKSTGLLHYVSKFMNPLMQFLGLPGEAALAYLSSILMNIYSAIAIIKTIVLTDKQLIILTTMCLIAHNFFVECIVMKKTGSSLRKMIGLRIVASLLAAWVLKKILPPGEDFLKIIPAEVAEAPRLGLNFDQFRAGLGPWFTESLFLVLQIFLLVFAVMLLQRILAEFGLIKKLSRIARLIMGAIGLPVNAAYVWIIANTVGLAYGAGIIMEEVSSGNMSRVEADLFNHSAAISHSQIEDTLLFVAIGVPYVWAALPRFVLSIIVVWLERWRRAVFRSRFRVKVV
jgi:hypothetical protein